MPLATPIRFDAGAVAESAYSHVDDYCDNFRKIESVESELLLGARAGAPQPLLSVVIPTFGRSKTLKEAIQSVLNQECVDFPWEVLVVDNTPLDENNSTPALELLREFQAVPVLYFHNRENIGSGYNWNRGVELAEGEWVTFLHDDDVLYPNALVHIEKAIKAHIHSRQKLGYIHARRDSFSDPEELKPLSPGNVCQYEELTRFRALILGDSGTGMPSCGTTILKQAYCEAGGINYDFGLTADAVLGYQIMKNYKVIVSDYALGAYRWADNETLKMTSLCKLIHSDYLFAKYRYSRNTFSRLWGSLFWKAELSENIRYKLEIGQKKRFQLTPQELCTDVPYAPAGRIRLLFYKLLRKMLLISESLVIRMKRIVCF